MKILVTGFDPFEGETTNSSIETVVGLPDIVAGARIIKLEIPTIYYEALRSIEAAIDQYDPDMILSIGQAGGRPDVTVERVGINWDDFPIPDNEGNQVIDEPVVAEGPAAYFVTLPIKTMVQKIHERGIPASISNTAGVFVCNHVLYGVCHMIATKYPGKRSGFIHVPYLPGQAVNKENMPSMSLDLMVEAVTAAIEAMVEDNNKDKDRNRG